MNIDFPVAIVGGGPCGMMTALLLARAGVSSAVFERKPGTSVHPKAMGISRRTAEILRQKACWNASWRLDFMEGRGWNLGKIAWQANLGGCLSAHHSE
jgi:2-polyprenyl-6-methoxyphenol hydroxylase-like FAD-dependent oxidoreductase